VRAASFTEALITGGRRVSEARLLAEERRAGLVIGQHRPGDLAGPGQAHPTAVSMRMSCGAIASTRPAARIASILADVAALSLIHGGIRLPAGARRLTYRPGGVRT
jgi:hypothetical protein